MHPFRLAAGRATHCESKPRLQGMHMFPRFGTPPASNHEFDLSEAEPRAARRGEVPPRVDQGVDNQGLGGRLHHWGVRWEQDAWRVDGEITVGFPTRAHPQVHDVRELRDMLEEVSRRGAKRRGSPCPLARS